MTENKCKSLENLLPLRPGSLAHTQLPDTFETYRNELHREMAMHWPFRTNTPDTTQVPPIASKSTAPSSIRNGHRSTSSFKDNDTSRQTAPSRRSKNVTTAESSAPIDRKVEATDREMLTMSEVSLAERQKRNEWNFKAREGVLTYRLPDGLSDGVALHNKLQKLAKTDTILLNDRHFWATLENRFKNSRKQNFYQNMVRLRQTQKQYEEELISKGLLPHTTEQAFKQYAEQQQQSPSVPSEVDTDHLHSKACLMDYISSSDVLTKKHENNLANPNEALDVFESDNVHPRLHEIFPDYKYRTKLGRDVGNQFQSDLYQGQMKIKTIFPTRNQQDRIREELEVVKTSEGLYAYSNRLRKQISK